MEAFPKAKIAANEALRIDPDLGEAHTPLAAVLWLHDWQWPEAQVEFNRSLALNPCYPTANHWYAEYLMTMGRHEQAIAKMKASQELDPLSLIISVAIGWAFYMARRFDEAIEQLERTVELDPNYPVTYWILGLLHRKMGRYDLAIVEGEKGVTLSGGSILMRAALAETLATAGRKKKQSRSSMNLQRSQSKSMSPLTFSPEYTSAWMKPTAQWNASRHPSKSTPTGSFISTSIRAWTPCAPARVFRICCAASGSP